LYDENISEVLRKFEIKVGDLENVSISENSLKQAGINTAPESIKSLIHLIKVGEEIAKFRSVRNLNENAQIEQYKLDKILKDLDADVLYDAIINDKIDNIRAKMMLKVFNPNLICFLHLSQDTYSRVFMRVSYKMPSLFLSVKETSAIAGKI
jgi:hypothetical protein